MIKEISFKKESFDKNDFKKKIDEIRSSCDCLEEKWSHLEAIIAHLRKVIPFDLGELYISVPKVITDELEKEKLEIISFFSQSKQYKVTVQTEENTCVLYKRVGDTTYFYNFDTEKWSLYDSCICYTEVEDYLEEFAFDSENEDNSLYDDLFNLREEDNDFDDYDQCENPYGTQECPLCPHVSRCEKILLTEDARMKRAERCYRLAMEDAEEDEKRALRKEYPHIKNLIARFNSDCDIKFIRDERFKNPIIFILPNEDNIQGYSFTRNKKTNQYSLCFVDDDCIHEMDCLTEDETVRFFNESHSVFPEAWEENDLNKDVHMYRIVPLTKKMAFIEKAFAFHAWLLTLGDDEKWVVKPVSEEELNNIINQTH